MGEKTGIAWTQHSWNPWQACHKVSAGCLNCYMFREKTRYGQDPNTVIRSSPKTFHQPEVWQRQFNRRQVASRGVNLPRELVFTCSWSDFFIPEADPWRDEAWRIIRDCPSFIFQILTKRPERITECLPADWGTHGYRNVWLGVTTENQAAANKRVPLLLGVPAKLHFVSAEPLIEEVSLASWLGVARPRFSVLGIGWVIAGCESGPERRPMDDAWARLLARECALTDVPFFLKQAERDGKVMAHPELDGYTWAEFPNEHEGEVGE